jgi:hypothetical protein
MTRISDTVILYNRVEQYPTNYNITNSLLILKDRLSSPKSALFIKIQLKLSFSVTKYPNTFSLSVYKRSQFICS